MSIKELNFFENERNLSKKSGKPYRKSAIRSVLQKHSSKKDVLIRMENNEQEQAPQAPFQQAQAG